MNLGEGGYIAEVISPTHEHCNSVKADSHSAVRRSAVFVGFYEEAELCFNLLVGERERTEHLLLKLVVCDTH